MIRFRAYVYTGKSNERGVYLSALNTDDAAERIKNECSLVLGCPASSVEFFNLVSEFEAPEITGSPCPDFITLPPA